MTTKTKTARTLGEVQNDHAALLARAEAGETIDPLALIQAAADVQIAEARAHGVDVREQEAAEAERKSRIAELVTSLTEGSGRNRAVRLLELHAQAIASLNALHDCATEGIDTLRAIDTELRTLGDLGPDVTLSARPGAIETDGVRYEFGHLYPTMLVADAAAAPAPHDHRLEPLRFLARQLHASEAVDQLRLIANV